MSWLRESGSLTRRLRKTSGTSFCVRVVRQVWCRPFLDEARLLGLSSYEHAIVREVILQGAGVPWVIARSVIPASTLVGTGRRLAHLGTRPLGDRLFSSQSVQRTHFEVTEITADTWQKAFVEDNALYSNILGRRSIYTLGKKGQLLVSEFFLPALLYLN